MIGATPRPMFVLLLVAALTLTGCGPTPHKKDPLMTPAESQKAMLSLIDDTIAELGGGQWSDRGVPAARDCRLPSGETGANYVGYTMGPASANPDADIAKVEWLWKSKHLSTRVVRSTNQEDTTIRLYGTGGPVTGISFYADKKRTSLEGESICVRGDAGTLIDESE